MFNDDPTRTNHDGPIPCMNCGETHLGEWHWYICDCCGFRVCASCEGCHKGSFSDGGEKCSRCLNGHLARS